MSVFKRVTGLSFVTYINHYRIDRAQALLAGTDQPIADISQQVGFCDQSYFGMVFRRIVGVTPVTYRRRVRSADYSDQQQVDHMPPLGPPSAVHPVPVNVGRAQNFGAHPGGDRPHLIPKRNGTFDASRPQAEKLGLR